MARCVSGAVADISPPAYTYIYFTLTFISPESFDNASTKLLRQLVLNVLVLFLDCFADGAPFGRCGISVNKQVGKPKPCGFDPAHKAPR